VKVSFVELQATDSIVLTTTTSGFLNFSKISDALDELTSSFPCKRL
jgi:hypothetical protein